MGRILNFSIPRSPLNNTTPIESSHAPPSPAGERRCTAAALVLQRHARAWLRRLKSCAGCGRASRGTRAPVETHALRLPARPPVGLALEVQLLDFRPLVSPPSANLRLRCDAHLFGSKARALLSPAVARTQMAMGSRQRPPPASRRVRAPFYATPLPAPASRAACPAKCAGLCGVHTHSGLPRARGEASSTAATARVWHAFFASRHPPRHAHTHSLTAAHGPPCAAHPPSREACTPSGRASHPRVSLRVPALHPPFSHQCTRPAPSHGEAAPPTARHSHSTAACSSLPTARKQVARGRRGGP